MDIAFLDWLRGRLTEVDTNDYFGSLEPVQENELIVGTLGDDLKKLYILTRQLYEELQLMNTSMEDIQACLLERRLSILRGLFWLSVDMSFCLEEKVDFRRDIFSGNLDYISKTRICENWVVVYRYS